MMKYGDSDGDLGHVCEELREEGKKIIQNKHRQ